MSDSDLPTSVPAGDAPPGSGPGDLDIGSRSVLADIAAEARPRVEAREAVPPAPTFSDPARRYAILSQLGAGAMGTVYLAFDRDLRRRVALKVVRGTGPRWIRRFLEEAQVMAQLDHPNIVPVFDVGRVDATRLYYTMRVVRGRTLAQVLADLRSGTGEARATWSIARRLQVFVAIAQAAGYAHAQGVLHRDLKPANVMLGAHGEVQVMDWGLSKVLGDTSIELTGDASDTGTGAIVGTPNYMAPEQALGGDIDARADLYALGVMLYELLTLTRPFAGSPQQVMAAHLAQPPELPRRRAPAADIPLSLEAICLRALAKAPGDRPASAEEMIAVTQSWLEAASDQARRHELAEAKVADGRQRLLAYRQLRDELAAAERTAAEVAAAIEPWRPPEDKAALIAAQDRVEALRLRIAERSAAVVETLERALEYEDGNAGARGLLADYYWSRLVEAEAAGDLESRDFFGQRVRGYHDGRYERELKGDGSLVLDSEPPGAEVRLYDFVPDGFVLVPAGERRLGQTPLGPLPLAMGSYLAVLSHPGYRDTRYPVFISRNRDWRGRVRLFRESEIGEGFVHVPAGPFIQGGDPGCRGWDLPRTEPEVGDFFLAVHPVTMGGYLEFVNHLARTEGIEAARRRSPRVAPEAAPYFRDDGQGGLRLPDWDPGLPVIGISRDDADAYCRWRSELDGRAYRLPNESEWEKAARGVDGRWFPWGWRFDPSLCNMGQSLRDEATPVPVERFPTDLSVYGVRGMAGNAREWTTSEWLDGPAAERTDLLVIRGGAWSFNPIDSRCAFRNRIRRWAVNDNFGFRLLTEPRPPTA